ncbi:hypothetical protein CP8484711_0796B, partial [Chlamydia psittaci 84-8471/1]
SF